MFEIKDLLKKVIDTDRSVEVMDTMNDLDESLMDQLEM